MTDNRFKDWPIDYRFPSPGVDVRFKDWPADNRFRDGLDTRFEGDAYGGVGVTISGVTINPFSATLTAPSGYAITAGSATIIVYAKPGSYGAQQEVAGTTTGGATGTLTENSNGAVAAAIALAGWVDGDTPVLGVRVTVTASLLPMTGLVALFDVSDLSTLFQDSAGIWPVTAAGQSVGLMLDKAQGLALGSELVTNGDFSTGTAGWSSANSTLSVASGALQMSAQTASPASAAQTISGMTVGRTYEVTAEYWQGGTGGTAARISFFGSSSQHNSTSTPLTAKLRIVATLTSASISLQSFGASSTVSYFRNISVRELPGYHARQVTAALRPTYQAGPARLIDDNIDDVLPVALTGTYSVYRAVSGALTYTEGVIMSGSYDILVNNMSACAIYDRALSAAERAQLAAYWGVTP